MDIKDMRRLIDAVTSRDVEEFEYQEGDVSIRIKRPSKAVAYAPVEAAAGVAQAPVVSAASAPADVPASQPVEGENDDTGHKVTAPIVGTFYAASSPDAEPYVKVGTRVKQGDVMCIIEAMKLMNEIEADASGTVTEILVQNEEPVEYGQALFRIQPD
jgi:acetyl-CoA carboxylase biotin carboxyl carrier protein